MSATKKPRLTIAQQQFRKTSLSKQVCASQQLAMTRLFQGLEGDGDVLAEVAELAGPMLEVRGDQWDTYIYHVNAAFALGIALGLMLPAQLFREQAWTESPLRLSSTR